MQSGTEAARSARVLLELDTQAVSRLRDLLLEEQLALAARDHQRLDGAVQNKLECLRQLERNEQERRQLLAHSGRSDWGDLLDAIDPALRDGWVRLRGSLREVAELTAVNEKIVSRTRYSTSRLLGLLRGQIEEADGVYDRSGRTSGYGDIRAITRA